MLEFIMKYWLECVFGLIVTGLTAGVTRINKKLKEERVRNQAIENGVRDILRMQILDTYERCKASGKISVSRKDAIDSAYKSYHALGGNGDMKDLRRTFRHLPMVPGGQPVVIDDE